MDGDLTKNKRADNWLDGQTLDADLKTRLIMKILLGKKRCPNASQIYTI